MQHLTFLIYSNLIVAVFLIFLALVLQTSNLRSAILFKVIPFFGGLSLLFNGLKLLNIL